MGVLGDARSEIERRESGRGNSKRLDHDIKATDSLHRNIWGAWVVKHEASGGEEATARGR
jgi:hypothetical protein